MPPKIPQSLVAVISPALALLLLLPPPASGQTGYAALRVEQGSNLAPTAGSRHVYIPEESAAWSYWTGDLGEPPSDWRSISFIEPSGWLSGQTSIGYGDADDNTILSAMRNQFTTVYLRHEFEVPQGEIPAMLHLRLYVDDGAIVWLNGEEIARQNVTAPSPAAGDTAAASVNNASWRDYFLAGTGGIVTEGTNVIAIHALNGTVSSSDFSIDLELVRPRLDFGHVEATSSDQFLPAASPDPSPPVGYQFEGTGPLAGKTFEVRSNSNGEAFGASPHAYTVATYSYRVTARPGFFLPHIKNWSASGFLGADALNSGFAPPLATFTQVQNHSWITTDANNLSDAELNEFVRRFDYVNSRDRILAAVGLNNGSGTVVPQVWGCSYNSITVGRLDGNHSRGGTVAGVDGAGRSKPDLIAYGNAVATSYSTANVSGMAALLLGIAYDHPELSNVYHPEVSKALMMASALKPAGWSNSSSQPLDPIWGTGELDAYHCYHLLKAGEHPASPAPVGSSGWDYAAQLSPATTASYTFIVPEGKVSERCSVVLNWFRQFEENPAANGFASLPVLPDFELRLFESQAGVPGTQLALSDSPVDNVEHIYLPLLPAGEYTLTLETDLPSSYAIAWENRLRDLPEVALGSVDPALGSATLDLQNLIIGETYTLQYSVDLSNWTDLHTVTAAAETESFVQMAIPVESRSGFYRIVWGS